MKGVYNGWIHTLALEELGQHALKEVSDTLSPLPHCPNLPTLNTLYVPDTWLCLTSPHCLTGTVKIWVCWSSEAMETVGAHLCVWHNTRCIMWLHWGRHMAVFTLNCICSAAVVGLLKVNNQRIVLAWRALIRVCTIQLPKMWGQMRWYMYMLVGNHSCRSIKDISAAEPSSERTQQLCKQNAKNTYFPKTAPSLERCLGLSACTPSSLMGKKGFAPWCNRHLQRISFHLGGCPQ